MTSRVSYYECLPVEEGTPLDISLVKVSSGLE